MTSERRRVSRKDALAPKKAVLKKALPVAKANTPVKKVGGTFAVQGEQDAAEASIPAAVEQGTNTMELNRPLQSRLDQKPPVARMAHAVTELVAPDEWAALLNSFEFDAEGSGTFMAAPKDAPGNGDALWERLSSTRWINDRVESVSDEVSNKSTVANRPI